jgi:hypothetical protein
MADILADILNTAPVLASIGNKTVNEGNVLPFTASATDINVPIQTLTYSLDAGAPAGASINSSSGVFSWTPTESQGGASYPITIRVTDNGLPPKDDFETITVIVNEVNSAPSLTMPSNKTLNELATLTATNTATDSDLPANTLTFALVSPPSGMSINGSSGVITWTPSEAQGPSTNTISVRVTDNGSPNLSVTNSFTVTVNEVNSAPVLTLGTSLTMERFANFESYSSGTANGVVMFRQPSYSGSTSSFMDNTTNITSVSSGFPAGGSGLGSRAVKAAWGFKTGTTNPWLRLISYNNAELPNPTIYMNQNVRFTMHTSKALKVGVTLRESATTAAIGGDGGINGTMEFVGVTNTIGSAPFPNRLVPSNAWTTLEFALPTEPVRAFTGDGVLTNAGKGAIDSLALVPAGGTGQYTIWVDNFEVISSASLASAITIYTSNTLTFTATSTDSDVPAQTRTYSLDAGAPAGASINSSSGAFTWTPTSGQANTTNIITARAIDDGSPTMSGAQSFTVIVRGDTIGVKSIPRPPAGGPPLQLQQISGGFELSYTRGNATEYVLETSTDLVTWSSSDEAIESQSVTPTGDDRELITYHINTIGLNESNQFFRIKAKP